MNHNFTAVLTSSVTNFSTNFSFPSKKHRTILTNRKTYPVTLNNFFKQLSFSIVITFLFFCFILL